EKMTPPSPLTSTFIAVASIFFLCLMVGVIGLLLEKSMSVSKVQRIKYDRYETGNPPHGRARGWFMVQYYPYIIVFLTIEPLLIFLFLFLPCFPFKSAVIFVLLLLSLIPPVIFGLDSARRLELWAEEIPRRR
ncbi:MAG: hypothetical protein DRJ31_09880, partial [Candidatus Methanomethylicota archaeon]